MCKGPGAERNTMSIRLKEDQCGWSRDRERQGCGWVGGRGMPYTEAGENRSYSLRGP